MASGPVDRELDRLLLERYPSWGTFAERARQLLPSGISHDSRFAGAGPFLPVAEGFGSRKRDIDGNEFVDYWMGHGALLLGHGNAAVVEAVRKQASLLTHAGGCHQLEHDWAELVCRMIPTAERVRFVSSGTEAVMLALRIARSRTGRERILKLEGHFHGWSDFTLLGIEPPFEQPSGGGYSLCALNSTVCVPAEVEAVREALESKQFAALILEPTGASGGAVPLPAGFLEAARELTKRTGTLLIFDEVITGFRVAPGGAQAKFGVRPDITCLAKVLAGGLPGGAVTGPAEVMEALSFSGDKTRDRTVRVAHWGTFNANPLSAAAGTACLKQIEDGVACRRADEFAARFREELNLAFRRLGVPWCAYGSDSVLHVNLLANACKKLGNCDGSLCTLPASELKRKTPLDTWLKKALWLEGIDWPGGKQAWCSALHSEYDLRKTVEAFSAAASLLKSLGALA